MKTGRNGWENRSSFLCSHFVTRNGNGNGSRNRIARSSDDMGYMDRSKQVNIGGYSTETEGCRTHIDSRVHKFTLYISHSIGTQFTSSHTTLTNSQISRVTAHSKHTTALNTWTAAVHTSQHCMAASNHTPHHQFTAWLQHFAAPVHITAPVRKFKSHTNTLTSSRELLKESESKPRSSRNNY